MHTWWYLTGQTTSFGDVSPARNQYDREVYFDMGDYCRELFIGRNYDRLVDIQDIPNCWADVVGIRWGRSDKPPSTKLISTTSTMALWVENIFNLLVNLLNYTWWYKSFRVPRGYVSESCTFLRECSRLRPFYLPMPLEGDDSWLNKVYPVQLPVVPYPTSIYYNHDPNLEESLNLPPEQVHRLGYIENGLGGIRGIPAVWLKSKPIMSALLFFPRFAESLIEHDVDITKPAWKPHGEFINHLAGGSTSAGRRFANMLAKIIAPLFVLSMTGSRGLWFIFRLLIDGTADQEAAEYAKRLLLREGDHCDGMNTWLGRLIHEGIISGRLLEYARVLYESSLDTFLYPRKVIY